jgi:hypothetical protein
VVIEPSFGGAAEDWEEIARTLAEETTVVMYDRAPYGASSAARDPDLVATAIGDVVRCARSGARLADAERAVSDAD